MDLRKIKKLIELLEDSTVAEMEITSGDEHIALRRTSQNQGGIQPVAALHPMPAAATQTQAPAAGDTTDAGESSERGRDEDNEPITAPIVGTYYEAPSPGAKPFVRPGQRVAKGDILCIIEAMKMMNEIKAPFAGTAVSVEVHNAQAVEFGQVLMYLQKT